MSSGVVAGVCRVCGCTDSTPCEGGCRWVDQSLTLCSQCVGSESVQQDTAALTVVAMEIYARQVEHAMYVPGSVGDAQVHFCEATCRGIARAAWQAAFIFLDERDSAFEESSTPEAAAAAVPPGHEGRAVAP